MPAIKTPRLIHEASDSHTVPDPGGGIVLFGKKYFYDGPHDTLIREDILKHRRKFREWNKFVEFVNSLT